MGELRTTDTSYGAHYWDTLDGGNGYTDSVMWQDIAHILAEIFTVDREAGVDRAGEHRHVDVGCAYGFLVRHMRRRGIESWGLDYSRYALSQAPEDVRENLRFFDLTKRDLSFFGSKTFTLLSCFETLEHIEEQYCAQAVQHLWSLLRPGGTAALAICVEGQPGWDTDPTHVTVRPREFWDSHLANVGFEPDHQAEDDLRRWWLFSQHKGIFVVRKPRS